MEMGCGEGLKETATLENGTSLKLMDMVCMCGRMEIDMKACGIFV